MTESKLDSKSGATDLTKTPGQPLSLYNSETVRLYRKALTLFSDLIFSLDCLRCLIDRFDELDPIQRASLLHSGIMAYFKAFQHGAEIGFDRQFIATLPGEPIALHERLKDIRDKLIAHTSGMFEDHFVGIFVESGKISGSGHFSVKFGGWDVETLKMVYGFICEGKNRVKARMQELQHDFETEVASLDLSKIELKVAQFTAK